MEAASKEFCKHACELVESDEFLTLSSECLEKIIGLDTLAVECEVQLFQALLRWADNECKNVGFTVTAKYVRSSLEKLIPLIRFPQIDPRDFYVHVFYEDILTVEEVQEVTAYHIIRGEDRYLIPRQRLFNSEPRLILFLNTSNIIITWTQVTRDALLGHAREQNFKWTIGSDTTTNRSCNEKYYIQLKV